MSVFVLPIMHNICYWCWMFASMDKSVIRRHEAIFALVDIDKSFHHCFLQPFSHSSYICSWWQPRKQYKYFPHIHLSALATTYWCSIFGGVRPILTHPTKCTRQCIAWCNILRYGGWRCGHLKCTCAMAPQVDSHLKVRVVENKT